MNWKRWKYRVRQTPVKKYQLVVAAIAVLLVIATAAVISEPCGVVDGVTIDGVDVSHLSLQQLREWARDAGREQLAAPVQLNINGVNQTIEPVKLGLQIDHRQAIARAWMYCREFSLWQRFLSRSRNHLGPHAEFVSNVAVSDSAAGRLARKLSVRPQNARLCGFGAQVHIEPERFGIHVDPGQLKIALTDAIVHRHPSVLVPFDLQHPAVNSAQLGNICQVRAQFSSAIRTPSVHAVHNIQLAINKLDGATFAPNEVLSFNRAVGRRLAEYGYEEAPAYVNGHIGRAVAGGICQVSSTLFIAAALADLQIVERKHHPHPTKCVPCGWDATVWYGRKDLKIRNTTDQLLVAHLWIAEHRVHVAIYGPPLNAAISLSTSITKTSTGKVHAELYRLERPYSGDVRRECIAVSNYQG